MIARLFRIGLIAIYAKRQWILKKMNHLHIVVVAQLNGVILDQLVGFKNQLKSLEKIFISECESQFVG